MWHNSPPSLLGSALPALDDRLRLNLPPLCEWIKKPRITILLIYSILAQFAAIQGILNVEVMEVIHERERKARNVDDTDAPNPLSEEQWQAVSGNDASFDGQFYYAVRTTRIFCRPSCKSRLPKRDNIRGFETTEQALAAGYRPCKRCRPTGQHLPDEEWISIVTAYIDSHYQESLSLQRLAHLSHGTPYHLHRTFKKVTGATPVEYIQQVRIKEAQALLAATGHSIAEIGEAVGLPNTSYFITLFKKKTGCTPEAYRRLQRQPGKESANRDNDLS